MAIGRTLTNPKKPYGAWKPVVLVGVVTERPVESNSRQLRTPNPTNFSAVRHAMLGMSVEEVYELTGIDPWFLDKMQQLETEKFLKHAVETVDKRATACSESGVIGIALRPRPTKIQSGRTGRLGVTPVYKTVDTCAEFEAFTPPLLHLRRRIRGATVRETEGNSGRWPEQIGQGIDYYCCHASYALKGAETIMVNSTRDGIDGLTPAIAFTLSQTKKMY